MSNNQMLALYLQCFCDVQFFIKIETEICYSAGISCYLQTRIYITQRVVLP